MQDTCPGKEIVKPCVCEEMSSGKDIRCERIASLDLIKVFENLDKNLNETEKHFSVFSLSNADITELKDYTFKDIVFDEIHINDCHKLTKINENAFNGTDLVTKYLFLVNNSALSSSDNSIYSVFRKFVNIQNFELLYNNMSMIPTNAFGSLENLLEVHFAGNSIKKIESQAFTKLPGFVTVSFEQVNFTTIPENAFQFDNVNNWTMIIDFGNSPLLTNSVFSQKSLLGMRRSATLRFGNSKYPKQMTYLDEKVFLAFLLENDKNSIDMNGEAFDCNDCRNYWLKKNEKAFKRISSLNCSDKKPFNDPAHFKNCTSYPI